MSGRSVREVGAGRQPHPVEDLARDPFGGEVFTADHRGLESGLPVQGEDLIGQLPGSVTQLAGVDAKVHGQSTVRRPHRDRPGPVVGGGRDRFRRRAVHTGLDAARARPVPARCGILGNQPAVGR